MSIKLLSSIAIESGRVGVFSVPGYRRLLPDQLCHSGLWRFIKHDNGDVLFCHNDFPFHTFNFFSPHKHLRQIHIPKKIAVFDPLSSYPVCQSATGLSSGTWTLHGSYLNHRRPHSNDHENEFFLFRTLRKDFS